MNKNFKKINLKRRKLITSLAVLVGLGVILPEFKQVQRPKELDLQQADLYSPHNLAG